MVDENRITALEARVASLEAAVGRLTLQATSSPIALVYPEPLATPLAKESGAGRHHERFFSLLDAGEACIQYTGALTMALSGTVGRPINVPELFRQPVPLGRWAELIREMLLQEGFPDTPVGASLRSSLFRPTGRPTPTGRYLFEEFINLRNKERGHGSSLPDEAYERLHLRHSAELHDALAACTFLAYPLVRVESVDVTTEPFSYDARLLVGPPPLTTTERIQSQTRVSPGAACVWDRGDDLIALADLMVYRTCPVCNLEHTFFLERLTRSEKHYHAYFGNHRFRESLGRTRRGG